MDILKEIKDFENSKPSMDDYYDRIIDTFKNLSGNHKELVLRAVIRSVWDEGKGAGITEIKYRLSQTIPNM